MANSDYLKILHQGVLVWNQWREEHPEELPDLSGVSFCGARLNGVEFSGMDFSGANFDYSEFRSAKFFRANLTDTTCYHTFFGGAKLIGANLTNAELNYTNLRHAFLDQANLCNAILNSANLSETSLFLANFSDAYLTNANLSGANLGYVNLHGATLDQTVFANVDFRKVEGLKAVLHRGPSTIGVDTIYKSQGEIPDDFLRDAGVPEEIIDIARALRTGPAIQLHSCFISYSTKDQEFAERLHSRMRQAELRVWFAPEDMKGGDYFFEQIERAIQLHDRLLLVLSEDSIQSKWVEREIRKARKVERAEKRRKLFPIRLVDVKTLREWECLDSDTGEDLAEEVRKYHIPDFSNWKNHDAFERAFARLEKDLRTSIGRK